MPIKHTVRGRGVGHQPDKVKTRHRQVVDASDVKSGAQLALIRTFALPNPEVRNRRPRAVSLRADNGDWSTIWEKYMIGAPVKINAFQVRLRAPSVRKRTGSKRARTCHSLSSPECPKCRKRSSVWPPVPCLGAATWCATRHLIETIPVSGEMLIMPLISPPSPSSAPLPTQR